MQSIGWVLEVKETKVSGNEGSHKFTESGLGLKSVKEVFV